MARPSVVIEWKKNETAKIVARVRANRKKLVRQYAASIQRIAHKNAPKRTGSGAASIYKAVAGEGSDYNERMAEARRRNKYFKAEPEEPAPEQGGIVAVAARHGPFMEKRTAFFEKAIESQRGKYLRDVRRIHEEDL